MFLIYFHWLNRNKISFLIIKNLFSLTCHIVVAANSISRSLINFGFSKNKKGFPGNDGKHDFDRRLPTNVSSNDLPPADGT